MFLRNPAGLAGVHIVVQNYYYFIFLFSHLVFAFISLANENLAYMN